MWRRPGAGPRGTETDGVAGAVVDDTSDLPTIAIPVVHDETPAQGTPVVAKAARRRPSWRKWVIRTALAIGGLVLAGALYFAVTLYQVWSTGHHDQARPVDAIVVMGAAQYDGRPSPLLKARLDHALELYQRKLAPYIVVTGGKQPGDRFTEATASRNYLRKKGVPTTSILSEDTGHSTWQSMDDIVSLLRGKSAHPTVLIVTDPFHCLRARLIAQELHLRAYVSATHTSPWGSGTQFRKSLKEAAGIAVGRIIGFHRLWKVTG